MIKEFLIYINNSQLLTTAISSLGLKIGAASLSIISNIFLARLLGPEELGKYTVIMAAINLAAIVATLGLPALVTREIAKYETDCQWSLIKGLISNSHYWITLMTIIILTFSHYLIHYKIISISAPSSEIFFAMLIIPLTAFGLLRAAILRGLHWIILADIPELIIRPILALLIITTIYFWQEKINSQQAIILQLTTIFCAFILGTWFLHLCKKDILKSKFTITENRSKVWITEAIPFFLITIISLLENQINIYALGYLSEEKQVAMFQVANQLVGLTIMGLASVNMPLQPKLATAWSRGDKIASQKLVDDAARLGATIALISAVVLIPLAELIITNFYGNQYSDAANILRILVVSQLINAIAGPCGLVLSATGQQRFALYAIVSALIVTTASNMILIPKYEAIGSALSGLLGMLTWNIMMIYWSWKKTNIKTSLLFLKKSR